jgi:Bacterial Ig-like domain (group 3)
MAALGSSRRKPLRRPSTSGGNPSGTVEFKDGANIISGCSAQPVNASTKVATCTTSALSVGTHSVTASHSGDANFIGSSTASAVTQTVAKATTSTTVRVSTSYSTQGESVTFTAAVAVTEPRAGKPSGAVTFFNGRTSLDHKADSSGPSLTSVVPADWTIERPGSGRSSAARSQPPRVAPISYVLR